jgi:hypothetical protein
LTFLSDMVLDLSQYENEKDYSKIKAEDLELLFSSDTLKFAKISNNSIFGNSSKTSILQGEYLRPVNDDLFSLAEILGVKMEILDPDTMIYGYKTLMKMGDGSYQDPSPYTKKISYHILEEFVYYDYPHMSLETKKKKAPDGKFVGEFSIFVRDLRMVTNNNYTVIRSRFEKVVDNE